MCSDKKFDFDLKCAEQITPINYLWLASDIKHGNDGKLTLKRKYGKYRRQPIIYKEIV